jgi:hypothetical protein
MCGFLLGAPSPSSGVNLKRPPRSPPAAPSNESSFAFFASLARTRLFDPAFAFLLRPLRLLRQWLGEFGCGSAPLCLCGEGCSRINGRKQAKTLSVGATIGLTGGGSVVECGVLKEGPSSTCVMRHHSSHLNIFLRLFGRFSLKSNWNNFAMRDA